MLHRLCRPPSIPLSFGLATVLPRRSVSRVSWAPDPRRPRANTHRLRHGLPGYLILFIPMLSHPSVGRDPESCLRFWRSFVDLRISPLHTKFHSPLSHSSELVSRAFRHFLATFTFNPIHRLRALYAQSFRRTLAPPVLPRLLARS